MTGHRFQGLLTTLLCLVPAAAMAQDWPQWNGPHRDGTLPEADIVEAIPADGLPQLWQQPVGLGFSGPAVVDGHVYLTDYQMESGTITNNPGTRDKLTGQERVLCFDAKTGKQIWMQAYDRDYALSYPSGPRATPTVHDGHVYALGAEGDLLCLDAKFANVVWEKQLAQEYDTEAPIWGHAASPLAFGDQLICLAGGEGSLVVSLNTKTGEEQWRALSGSNPGYCPPTMIEHAGVRQLLIWDPEMISSLNPDDGSIYWQKPLKPAYGMAVAPPLVEGNLMFVSGAGDVSAMYELHQDKPGATLLWNGTPRNALYQTTSGAIFDNGYIYGADNRSGALVCFRAEDGERMWQTSEPTTGAAGGRRMAHGSAFLFKADDHYLIFSETGDLISAELSPEGYQETGRFHVLDPTNPIMGRDVIWSYPAIADKCLFVRNDKELRCYNLAADN